MNSDIEKLCTLFLTSISRTKLYGTEHNFTRKSANEFLKIFEKEAGISGKVEIIISDEWYSNPIRFGFSLYPF